MANLHLLGVRAVDRRPFSRLSQPSSQLVVPYVETLDLFLLLPVLVRILAAIGGVFEYSSEWLGW